MAPSIWLVKLLEDTAMRIAALAGGVGASKLLLGLYHTIRPANLTVVVNTADDLELHGLAISPDLDIVTYTLAGIVNPETGWGVRGDTFRVLEGLRQYGREGWFNLGDADLVTHIHRTALLRSGWTLTEATDAIRRVLKVEARILPMSDQPVRTKIVTSEGILDFQEYLVKRHAEPRVREIRFEGASDARPAPGVIESLAEAESIVICPSNPLISIGPILAVPGVRQALRSDAGKVIAVSPIVGGRSLKGPSDKMLAELGFEVSAAAVARLYQDVATTYVIDSRDSAQRTAVEKLGMKVVEGSTVMKTLADKKRLAQLVVSAAASPVGTPLRSWCGA
jgi:LPPG:FO 2-phospho-L-lactate transferase